jgi:hypothetical protein
LQSWLLMPPATSGTIDGTSRALAGFYLTLRRRCLIESPRSIAGDAALRPATGAGFVLGTTPKSYRYE